MAVAGEVPIERLRGIALFDPERDALLTSLSSFETARQAVIGTPNFSGRFGTEEGLRILLQFAYQYFKRIDFIEFRDEVFNALWCDFAAELEDAYWKVRGVANIKNFASASYPLDLEDGVTIRGRSKTELASLGFDADVWDRIAEDWRGFGASSFVLVAEHCFPKQPGNIIMLDTSAVSTKATRAIQALRLAGPGSIGLGPMWVVRPARFNVGFGGLTSTGTSIPMLGAPFNWTEEVQQAFPPIRSALAKLEPPRVCRRPICLSHAAMAGSSICA